MSKPEGVITIETLLELESVTVISLFTLASNVSLACLGGMRHEHFPHWWMTLDNVLSLVRDVE